MGMPSAQHDDDQVPDCLIMGSYASRHTSLRVQSIALGDCGSHCARDGTKGQMLQHDMPHARLLHV